MIGAVSPDRTHTMKRLVAVRPGQFCPGHPAQIIDKQGWRACSVRYSGFVITLRGRKVMFISSGNSRLTRCTRKFVMVIACVCLLLGCSDMRTARVQQRIATRKQFQLKWISFRNQLQSLHPEPTANGLVPVPTSFIKENQNLCSRANHTPGTLVATYVTESQTHGSPPPNYLDVNVLMCQTIECLDGRDADLVTFLLVDGRTICRRVDRLRYKEWLENLPSDGPWLLPLWIEDTEIF